MKLDLFHQSVVVLFLLSVVSCSGPQMISPPETDSAPKETKKVVVAPKETVAIEIPVDDTKGIFDDEHYQLKTDLTQWKMIADEEGIQTYEKIKRNSGLVAFRGEILIPAPLKKVATILIDDKLQKDWVDSFVSTRVVSEISELEHVEYNQTKVPWPFQNRDFVFNVIVKPHPQPPTLVISMKSIVDPKAPPTDGVVRGDIVHSYYYLKEMSGMRATKMVVEMEVDPKGAIPLWLVNLSQKGWPQNTLAAVKKLSLREDIPVMPKLEKYFEEKKIVVKAAVFKKKKGKNK